MCFIKCSLFYYHINLQDQVPAELIHAGGETIRPEIHKLINPISNKEEFPQQSRQVYCCAYLQEGQ
jgi:hypothetical protein